MKKTFLDNLVTHVLRFEKDKLNNPNLTKTTTQHWTNAFKPHSHCAGVATVHPDAGQPVYRDTPGHIL